MEMGNPDFDFSRQHERESELTLQRRHEAAQFIVKRYSSGSFPEVAISSLSEKAIFHHVRMLARLVSSRLADKTQFVNGAVIEDEFSLRQWH